VAGAPPQRRACTRESGAMPALPAVDMELDDYAASKRQKGDRGRRQRRQAAVTALAGAAWHAKLCSVCLLAPTSHRPPPCFDMRPQLRPTHSAATTPARATARMPRIGCAPNQALSWRDCRPQPREEEEEDAAPELPDAAVFDQPEPVPGPGGRVVPVEDDEDGDTKAAKLGVSDLRQLIKQEAAAGALAAERGAAGGSGLRWAPRRLGRHCRVVPAPADSSRCWPPAGRCSSSRSPESRRSISTRCPRVMRRTDGSRVPLPRREPGPPAGSGPRL